MYAVVVMGSRIRRSACGMNLSTFCCARAQGALSTAVTASVAIKALVESSEGERRFIEVSRAIERGGQPGASGRCAGDILVRAARGVSVAPGKFRPRLRAAGGVREVYSPAAGTYGGA